MNRPRRDERGSGTVYALGVIAVLLAAAVGIAGLIQAQSATGRARAAADLAAISGATVLSSVVAPGDPCAMAGRVAAANGASVSACSVAGEDVTVSVVVPTTILGRPRHPPPRPVPVPSTPRPSRDPARTRVSTQCAGAPGPQSSTATVAPPANWAAWRRA